MHTSLLLTHFASIFGFEPWTIAIVVPVVSMIFAGVMAVSGMYFKSRERQMWHETARIALEKGQPLPDLPDGKWPRRLKSGNDWSHDLRGGLVLIGVGVGIYLFFEGVGGHEARFLGAIPGFIGVALLLHALLNALLSKKNPPPQDRPPQS